MPKPVPSGNNNLLGRPHSSICDKKMGPMDLAICWDYRPFDPRDEPKPPMHIDGSNDSAGPAVFSVVRTPREVNPDQVTGRSTGALFSNTLGQESFFNKDLLTRNREYNEKYSLNEKCECDVKKFDDSRSVRHSASQRSQGSSRRSSSQQRPKTTATREAQFRQENYQKSIYKSSPNLTEFVAAEEQIATKIDSNPCHLVCISHRQGQHNDQYLQRFRSQPELNFSQKQRIQRECHKLMNSGNAPKVLQPRTELRPFKAGIPNRTSYSLDSGCGSMEGNCGSHHPRSNHQPQLRIPKPKDPYAAKNYNINTLAPPFACWKGGAGQGGYPEHWRLASVYQHAFKPIDQRRRPLLQTVYQ